MLAEKSRALYQELGRRPRHRTFSPSVGGGSQGEEARFCQHSFAERGGSVLFREVGDQEGAGLSLPAWGGWPFNQGEFAEARALLEESLALHRR